MPARLRYLRYRTLDGLLRGRLDHMKRALGLGAVEGARDFVFTADNTTNTITVAGQDGLSGRAVVHGADLPTGLESGTVYELSDAGLNAYSLLDENGDVVAFTDNGSGTLTLSILD